MRLLLSAHLQGVVAGEVSTELDIPASTLSHHLEKRKNEGLVSMQRESTFLWYSAGTANWAVRISPLRAGLRTRKAKDRTSQVLRSSASL